jgi:hypothetical protein
VALTGGLDDALHLIDEAIARGGKNA